MAAFKKKDITQKDKIYNDFIWSKKKEEKLK